MNGTSTIHLRQVNYLLILAVVLLLSYPLSTPAGDLPAFSKRHAVEIRRIPSIHPEGYGYRIEYQMPVPIHVCWRFKTDFENDFLQNSRIIASHRLVHRAGNVAITEIIYAAAPGKRFVWETTTDVRNFRMTFRLIHPRSAGQRYHHGVIRMIAMGGYTLVIQKAYFDFAGAGFWVHYPWHGGMRDILKTTARWEQQTVNQLQLAYR